MDSLKCVPSSGSWYCREGQKIRVRVPDKKKDVTITALYDGSEISVSPATGTTNEDGHLEIEVRCTQPCPSNGTITFDADKGDYEHASFTFTCSQLPPTGSIAFDPSRPGNVAYVLVPMELSARRLPLGQSDIPIDVGRPAG